MKRPATSGGAPGFSLVEVMIALIIIAVGMLGIAKLEAVVLSTTSTSRVRALVALQAQSLSDAMHADRDFWDGLSGDWTSPLSVSVSVVAGTPTITATNSANLTAALGAAPTCSAACSPVTLAGHDVNQWVGTGGTTSAGGLATVLQNSTASIDCLATAGFTGMATCTVTISWTENVVAANQQEASVGAPADLQQQTYTTVVQP
jgi:type IV pilus assembly protein PilV